jgi:hypothetical protein
MLGHLKLHTVGDMDLSHSLGIDFRCAGNESEYEQCRWMVRLRDASLRSRMPVARRIKDGDPSEMLATIA